MDGSEHDVLTETNGFAAFAAAEPNTDDGRLQVHGVMAGVGDISKGMSGKWTVWTEDVLRDAAERSVFDGKPITLAESMDPEQHVGVEKTGNGLRLTGAVPMEAKVGEITNTEYQEDVGLVFEGFISDSYAEDLVERGLAQTSPVLAREAVLLQDHDYDVPEDRDLYEATELRQARDLALVADGGFPSNEINPGSTSVGAMMAEALSAHTGFGVTEPDGGAEDGPDSDTETEAATADPVATHVAGSGAEDDGGGDSDPLADMILGSD